MQRREGEQRANTWATVSWQLGDTPQLRRTLAMPHETVGTLMRRALEEASMMGFISEEEAFSKDAPDNWRAYALIQGKEEALRQEDRLEDRLPPHGGRLLFRPSPDGNLRAAPLRLSLDGITYTPPQIKQKKPWVTWLLFMVILLLIGVVSVVLWQRLTQPPAKPAKDRTPARQAAFQGTIADAGALAPDAQLTTPDSLATHTETPGEATPALPDNQAADASPDSGQELAPPKPIVRKVRKVRKRRKKRRVRKKRNLRKKRKVRKKRNLRKVRKRTKRPKQRKPRKRTKRPTKTRKPPAEREP